MTAIAAAPERLDIGRVVRDVFDVLGRNFSTFAILALILAGIPSFLFNLFFGLTMRTSIGTLGARMFNPLAAPVGAGGGLISWVMAMILQAALIYGVVSDMNGKRATVSESLSNALRVFAPLLLISILLGLAVGFGLVLLIVPGVMIAIAWCLAAPVYVVERIDLFAVFGRSADLTRGSRWRIFWLAVLLGIALIVVEAIVGIPIGLFAFMGGIGHPAVALLQGLEQAIVALVSATAVAVLYVELRKLKEGVGAERLAAVFD